MVLRVFRGIYLYIFVTVDEQCNKIIFFWSNKNNSGTLTRYWYVQKERVITKYEYVSRLVRDCFHNLLAWFRILENGIWMI